VEEIADGSHLRCPGNWRSASVALRELCGLGAPSHLDNCELLPLVSYSSATALVRP
jgi:hypothetical protein